MLRILHFAFSCWLSLTNLYRRTPPLCQSPLEAQTQRRNTKGSASVLFLCDGAVVHEHSDFRAPAYNPDHKFILMYQVGATVALLLGAIIPRGFSSIAGFVRGRLAGCAKNSSQNTSSQKARRWQASLRVIWGQMGPSRSVRSSKPILGSRIPISLVPAVTDSIQGAV